MGKDSKINNTQASRSDARSRSSVRMHAPGDIEPLFSPEALAEYMGVPLATVYMWNHRNTGPKRISVGKYTRYRKSDVERWLDSRPEKTRTR